MRKLVIVVAVLWIVAASLTFNLACDYEAFTGDIFIALCFGIFAGLFFARAIHLLITERKAVLQRRFERLVYRATPDHDELTNLNKRSRR